MSEVVQVCVALTRHEAEMLVVLLDHMWPADARGPAAGAIGVVAFVDRALDGQDRGDLDLYRRVLPLLDRAAKRLGGERYVDVDAAKQRAILSALQTGKLQGSSAALQVHFFETLRRHLIEGLFSDPAHAGNRDALGWRSIGFPGVFMEWSREEQTADTPSMKGGLVRTMVDYESSRQDSPDPAVASPGFDPERGCEEPIADCDIVVVGFGGVGAVIAPQLAHAGLKVVVLEAGPWRPVDSYKPDELTFAYYARAGLSTKFDDETPRWRTIEQAETRPMTYSLGRMCNGVGGSLLHYGARLRRFHSHHFAMRSTVSELGLDNKLPEDTTLADWPVSYADLEPHYERLEQMIGISGADDHPFIPRRSGLPMPPTNEPRCSTLFAEASRSLGLHPQPIPIGQNTAEYRGRAAMTYSPWGEGLGLQTPDRWMPMWELVPSALATGRLDLRTRCRVLRVLSSPDGRVSGVEYVDPDGRIRIQRAPKVILAAYTFETVRLLLLSRDGRHPNGMGNNAGQLGQHFMTKQYPSVIGHYRDRIFNRHTGPASQGTIVEDFLAKPFLASGQDFIGGGTLGTENQLLPIQIGRETPPPDVPLWGESWKSHVADWNHRAVIRIQTDTLSYRGNYLDLDPVHRDRSSYGLPLLRVTYSIRDNEKRLYEWMLNKAEGLQRLMGADKIWRGPIFTGIGSCHDFGGCRMGHDPATSVVDAGLEVHDTPGLYVMGGAVLPTCHGVNPTLTIWALCQLAADRIVSGPR